MPSGMKGWLAVVAALLTIVALWRLPPDYVQPPRDAASLMTPESRRHAALRSELLAAERTLDRIRMADTLPLLAIESAEDGVAILVERGDRRPEIAQSITGAIRSLPRRDPSMVVAYVEHLNDHADLTSEDVAMRRPGRADLFVGELNGTPYCLHVFTPPTGPGEPVFDRRRSLGPCRLYAAYGLPGPGIAAWLERGGIDFGHDDPSLTRRESAGTRRLPSHIAFLGYGSGGSVEVERCATGDRQACATVFGDPDGASPGSAPLLAEVRASPALTARTNTFYSLFDWAEASIFADLQVEFGSDAFQRFWTSPSDVDVAFEEAFGVDHGTWLLSWVDRVFGIERATPAPRKSTLLSSLLWFTLMSVVVTVRQRRRVVS